MPEAPFMPKATAVWLVENTKISFKQIADFCNLHELEVKGIADGNDKYVENKTIIVTNYKINGEMIEVLK